MRKCATAVGLLIYLIVAGIYIEDRSVYAKIESSSPGSDRTGFRISEASSPDPSCRVFAFNNLGMHCYDYDYSVFSILPPFNVLNAQVIRIGPVPAILTNNDVHLTYSAICDPKNSINRTSTQIGGKTNFWQYALKLFNVRLSPDQGLTGTWMPTLSNKRRAFGPFDPSMNWFSATGIPITDRDDARRINRYPMMKVEAFDSANKRVASLSAVLPVSSEAACYVCHQTGNDAASDGFWGVSASQWSSNRDIGVQVRENILILHDAINHTNPPLMSQKPVVCNQCHYSPALDLSGVGHPTGQQVGHELTSHAIHKHHGTASTLTGIVPIPDEGVNTCYYCHPGQDTQCLRGAMAGAGLICQNCHGGLLAVADPNRMPWKDEPKCQSCHTGDALSSSNGQTLINRIAYTGTPDAINWIIPGNKRFAENADPADPGGFLLYRNSQGHAGSSGNPHLACPACHGSPHAEWPTANPADNWNVTATQLQGHPGPIVECTVCHGKAYSPPPEKSLGGPHGIHSINDPNWWNVSQFDHKYYLTSDTEKEAARLKECQACHGLSFEGTAISKTFADRVFMTGPMMNNQIRISKNTPVSCALCHPSPQPPTP